MMLSPSYTALAADDKENAMVNPQTGDLNQGLSQGSQGGFPNKKRGRFPTAAEKRMEQQAKRRPLGEQQPQQQKKTLQRSMSSPVNGFMSSPVNGFMTLSKGLASQSRPAPVERSVLADRSPLQLNRSSTEGNKPSPASTALSILNFKLSASTSPEKGQRSPRGLSDDDMDDSEDTQVRRQLPCEDFSLKTAVCFRSSRPFDWCRAIPSAIEARALMIRAAMVPPPLDDEGRLQADDTPFRSEQEALESWVSNSLYYAHPAEPMFMDCLTALQAHRERNQPFIRDPADDHIDDTANFTRRLRQWEDAFVSLFQAYSHGLCRDFYYQTKDFTVHFTRDRGVKHEDPNKPDPSLMAVFSCSNRWLRLRLREEGIAFCAPLVSNSDLDKDEPRDESADVAEELDSMSQHALVERARPRKPRQAARDIPPHKSCLVVRGHMPMRGLYSFLLSPTNAVAPKHRCVDVPRLISTQPFLHASIKRLQLFFNAQVQRSGHQSPIGSAAATPSELEAVYQVKLRGPLLPHSLRQLCRVVHYMHHPTHHPRPDSPHTQPQPRSPCSPLGRGLVEESKDGSPRSPMDLVSEEKEGWDEEGDMVVDGLDWSVGMEVLPGTEAFNLPPPSAVGEGREVRAAWAGAGKGMRRKTIEEVRFQSRSDGFLTRRYRRRPTK